MAELLNKQQTVFRSGIDDNGPLKKALFSFERILFVTGNKSFKASGAEAFIKDELGLSVVNRYIVTTSTIQIDTVSKGCSYVQSLKPDCIVAVGGGSVMDMAKLLNIFSITDISPDEFARGEALSSDLSLLPFCAIPTTAGSGSEATSFAVLYEGSTKYSVSSQLLRPDYVLLHSRLTETMSPYQTACSGYDALSQAIESYWAKGATDRSRKFSKTAIRLCMMHLREAVHNPTAESRYAMSEAAYYAGCAINIGKTTAAHALSYSLTAHYSLPHGHAVSVFLPWVCAKNELLAEEEKSSKLFNELRRLIRVRKGRTTFQALAELSEDIGLTFDWLPSDTSPEKMSELVLGEVNVERLKNNPFNLTESDLGWICEQAFMAEC